jgi:transcriptional regulator GlxA family with amidase domain
MLEGSFDLCIAGKVLPCQPGTAFTEPPGERHANRIETAGAHVLVVQPDLARVEELQLDAGLVHDVRHFPRSPAVRLAAQMVHELRSPDPATPIALEGLALELLALLTRTIYKRHGCSSTPPWLERAEDVLRCRFRDPLRVSSVANEVGVHPVHLARVFRAKHGVTLGTFVRQLRLQWAAEQLVKSDLSLATVALRAGFADQSHFGRLFKSSMGVTPHLYLEEHTMRQARPRH